MAAHIDPSMVQEGSTYEDDDGERVTVIIVVALHHGAQCCGELVRYRATGKRGQIMPLQQFLERFTSRPPGPLASWIYP